MSVTAVPIRPLSRGAVLKFWLGLAFLLLLAVGLAWIGTSGQQRMRTASGLEYQIVDEGEGNTITPADLALVHFVGRRENGEVFANTLGQEPVPAAIGNFIPGFDEGLQLMRQGSRYKLWIPPQLGYRGQVPPGAPFEADETLMFDIRVLQVAPGMAAMQQMMGQPGGGRPQGAPPPEGGQTAAPEGTQPAQPEARPEAPPTGNSQR